jgi:hypothetical protein
MTILAAANTARTHQAMSKRINVDGDTFTIAELMDEGRIAYVRERTMRDGKVSRGIILHDDITDVHNTNHATLAEALAYTPFYETPKLVTDYLYADGIAAVRFNTSTDEYRIERKDI